MNSRLRKAAALGVFVVALSAAWARADDGGDARENAGRVSIGIEGVGNQFANGQPTFRWAAKPQWSLDVTPLINFSHFNAPGQSAEQHSYGLNLGLVKVLNDAKGLRFGLGFLAGYSYAATYDNLGSPQNVDQTGKSWTMRLGVGPDLEYRLPVLPQLSLGAHAFLQYSLTQTWDENFFVTSPGPGATSLVTGTGTSTQHSLGFVGEAFTVRYYF